MHPIDGKPNDADNGAAVTTLERPPKSGAAESGVAEATGAWATYDKRMRALLSQLEQ